MQPTCEQSVLLQVHCRSATSWITLCQSCFHSLYQVRSVAPGRGVDWLLMKKSGRTVFLFTCSKSKSIWVIWAGCSSQLFMSVFNLIWMPFWWQPIKNHFKIPNWQQSSLKIYGTPDKKIIITWSNLKFGFCLTQILNVLLISFQVWIKKIFTVTISIFVCANSEL